MTPLDAVVVGGGVFGCWVALVLRRLGLARVTLLEREPALCARASQWNQARVHNGYHYPRSFVTAHRSRANRSRFVQEFGPAVRPITSLYAVARRESKRTALEFERFADAIGEPARRAPTELAELFAEERVEAVYLADEPVFDGPILAGLLGERLREAGVELRLGVEVHGVRAEDGALRVDCGDAPSLRARWVVNCSYADLHRLAGSLRPELAWQLAEIALIEPPRALRGVGVTVVDGPFFSTLPFPSRALHSLSHVVHTPHLRWSGHEGGRPSRELLARYQMGSRADRMLRDAVRYLPCMAQARYVESFYEVKTLRAGSLHDGRPIILHRDPEHRTLLSVLGGKVDNIFDIEAALIPLIQEDGP